MSRPQPSGSTPPVNTIETGSRFPYAGTLLSGIALVLGYPPFSIPVLPFVGLVPYLAFLRVRRPLRQVVVGSLWFGVPYLLGNVYWLWNLGEFTPAGYAGAVGAWLLHLTTFLGFPLSMFAIGRTRRVPPWLAAPPLWLVFEHARSYGDFSFPWVTLGYSLSEWPRLIQHADIVGAYGLSVWLVLINALIAGLVTRGSGGRRRMFATGLAAVVAVPLAYGVMRWNTIEDELASAPTIRIAVLQPNIPQRLKWQPEAYRETAAILDRQITEAESRSPDLVVGPEASVPIALPPWERRLPVDIDSGAVPVLLGALVGVQARAFPVDGGADPWDSLEYYNSAVLARPDRTVVSRHDKHYLVPVTEQIPYSRVFGFLLPFMRGKFGDFLRGGEPVPLDLEVGELDVRLGVLICYESMYPEISRSLVNRGANVLVNITNDAWFGRSSMPYQHFGFMVLRSIETRRFAARSANTGISGFIDPLGRVVERSGIFGEALLDSPVTVLHGGTPYVRVGDLSLYLSYMAAAALAVLAWRSRPGRRS